MKVDADVIVLAGVHFMAETAKMLNPAKTVLIPDLARRLFARGIDHAADVRLLRQRYPGVPVVTYVNTSAAVKAESDICCTSANAPQGGRIARRRAGDHAARRVSGAERRREDRGQDHPLGRPLRGARALHRRQIRELRGDDPGVVVLAHPECPPEVIAAADFAGSTAAMAAMSAGSNPRASC